MKELDGIIHVFSIPKPNDLLPLEMLLPVGQTGEIFNTQKWGALLSIKNICAPQVYPDLEIPILTMDLLTF